MLSCVNTVATTVALLLSIYTACVHLHLERLHVQVPAKHIHCCMIMGQMRVWKQCIGISTHCYELSRVPIYVKVKGLHC